MDKLICSDSEGLFLSQITRKILYAYTVFFVSNSYVSLCHILQFFLINRKASSPPTSGIITAGNSVSSPHYCWDLQEKDIPESPVYIFHFYELFLIERELCGSIHTIHSLIYWDTHW